MQEKLNIQSEVGIASLKYSALPTVFFYVFILRQNLPIRVAKNEFSRIHAKIAGGNLMMCEFFNTAEKRRPNMKSAL